MLNLFSANIAYASFDSILSSINNLIINPLIVLMFSLALVFFLFGVFEFIANQANEEKKTAGKQHMIWGIIGITIMMGVWFFMNLILDTLNINSGGSKIDPEAGTVHLNDYNPSYPKLK